MKQTSLVFLLFILVIKSLNAQLEIPKFSKDIEIIWHHGFTLSYSEEHEQPLWVAYELDINKLSGSIRRSNRFRIEDLLL